MINIDLDKAKALVDECIAERGAEYVYEKEGSSCKYVHGIEEVLVNEWETKDDFTHATPGCLVGAALHKAGVPLEKMGTPYRNDQGSFDLVENLTEDGLISMSQEANNFFGNCQASQDSGAQWGPAAQAAARGNQLENTYDGDGQKTGVFAEREGAIVA